MTKHGVLCAVRCSTGSEPRSARTGASDVDDTQPFIEAFENLQMSSLEITSRELYVAYRSLRVQVILVGLGQGWVGLGRSFR